MPRNARNSPAVPRATAERPALRSKMKIHFVDLLRPDHGFGFVGLSVQQAVALFQWMVRTSAGYPGVRELLSCQGTCINFAEVRPFGPDWLADLRERFLCALLDTFLSASARRWRQEQRIDIDSTRWVPVRYYDGGRDYCDQAVEEAVDGLFDFAEWRFRAPPNRRHPRANVVHDVRLHVYPDTYAIDLAYGYARDRSSHWCHRVHSDRDEIFIDFVRRAAQELRQTLRPPVRKPTSTTRGARWTSARSY